MKLPLFRKADIVLAVVLLIIGVGSLFAFRAGAADASAADPEAVVTVDGTEQQRLKLSEDQTVIVESAYGTNTVTVKDGSVFVSEADCLNRDCVRMGSISKPGQIIVCLPHHFSVTVVGGAESPDAVIK